MAKRFFIVEEESGVHSPPALAVRAFLRQKKIVGTAIKNTLFYHKDGHFKWCFLLDEIYDVGKIVLERVLSERDFLIKISAKIRMSSRQLFNFAEEIRHKDLTKETNKKLLEAYKKYCQILGELYLWGLLIETMEIPHNLFSKFLEEEIEKVILVKNLQIKKKVLP